MYKALLFAMMLALLVGACSDFNTVKIKRTNFEEEIQRAQNLVFTFNKELIGDSSMMNRWDTISYIKFEPSIAGRFMWTSGNELTFSPSGPLPPSTEFKAVPLPIILEKVKKGYSLDEEPVIFHTPYLDVNAINTYWSLSEDPSARIEVRMQVNFNNPVSPLKLKSLLQVVVAGKSQPFIINSNSDGEMIEISIRPDEKDLNEETSGVLIIAAGMPSVGGSIATLKEIKSSFIIPSKDKLEIASVETGFDQGIGVITVNTTQPVQEGNLQTVVSVEPRVEFTTSLESSGFVLKGDFRENQAYTLKVSKDLNSVFGKNLQEEYVETISFGALEPYVGFVEKNAMYLSSKGYRNLAVNIINVPTVRISVFKIFENNIQHYMRMGMNWDYVYDNDEYYDFYGYAFDENYGKAVMSKEIQTRSLPKTGNISLLNIDPDEMQINDQFKGVYLVKVESTDKRWLQDVQILSLSDLGIIVKKGSTQTMVFVNSLRDASPVKAARVDFLSTNNQKLYSAVTDNQGVVVFNNTSQVARGFKLGMISVRNEQDFNFVLLNQSRVETSRFDVGGKNTQETGYDVFIYGDRNLYRPGDSLHVNIIVRTLKWETVRNIPVKIKLITPSGKEMNLIKKQLGSFGAVTASFYVPPHGMTGTYMIEVLSGNNVQLASRRVSVEEFVPDRIKLTVKTDKTIYRPGEQLKVSAVAENLYGTPAINKKFETEVRLTQKQIRPAAFPDYNFSITTKDMPLLSSVMRDGLTDQAGKAEQEIKLPEFKNIGLLAGSVFSTVFDETGRPVNRLNIITIPTQDVYFGVRNQDHWVGTRKPVSFRFVAVNMDGKLVGTAKANVSVTHYRYETVIERGYSRYNYVSQRRETVMLNKVISVNQQGSDFLFTPSRSGEYEVKIAVPGSNNYVSFIFYAYGWNDTDYSSFEVDRDGEITITSDKPGYKTGEKAKLLFKAPFDGQLLVAYEQNDVLEYKYLTLKNKAASLEIPVTSSHLPNIFIDATAFRKTLDEFMPLTVAHGIVSLKVDDPSLKLKVGIKAADKSRSGVKQTITLNTLPNAEVTVAVVDEGILQITDYKSPDPYSWYYAKRALGVGSFDVYGQLYPEMRPSSSVAGGEAFDLARRINPLTNDRVKLISKWSGALKSNASGVVTFPIDIPQFSGALRVMAVAYKDNKFGMAEHTMKVADPIVLSMALPRFLTPGDKVNMSASLTNTTSSTASASIKLEVSGPLAIAGGPTRRASLKPGKEEILQFDITAQNNIGQGEVKLNVQSGGQTYVQTIRIPVRPAAGLQYNTGSGAVKAGSIASFKVLAELMPASTKSKLYLTKSPAGRFLSNLNQLLRYPYGCLEQTVSVAFPQLYFKELIKATGNQQDDFVMDDNPDHNIQQAILKIETMQLYNGGFSLWESGGTPDWWPTAYALHFLGEAQLAGYEINRKVLEGGLGYLEQKVKERELTTYFYYEGSVLKSRTVPRQEIFYSLYVLALNDRPAVSVMNYYKTQLNQLTTESRYLLASSYMLAGDRKSYQAILPRAFGQEKALPVSSGSYGSYLRDLALALNAVLEADRDNPQVGEMTRRLSEEMDKPNQYYSTQENAFTLLAIGKQVKRAMNSSVKAQISYNGKAVNSFSDKDLTINNSLMNSLVSISASGNGMLYYSYELSGIGTKPMKGETDNGLKVRKRFFDRNGRALTSSSFNQNDLVVVEIAAQSIDGRSISNVAITDLLPACFEIENSRLFTEREYTWIKGKNLAEYTDIRDDRITYFATLSKDISYFYYTVRVVGKGRFTVGPVSADAMYDGSYHSYSGSEVVSVK